VFIRILAALLLSLWFASSSLADEFGPYLGLNLGFTTPSDSDISVGGSSGQASYGAGFYLGAAVGYRNTDWMRGEVSFSYRKTYLDEVTSGGIRLTASGGADTFAMLANQYFELDLGLVTPYVGGGVGAAFIDVETDPSARLVVNDNSWQFAWNVMGG